MTSANMILNNDWQRAGAIAPGATVLDIAVGASGRVWLATTAGIWEGEVGHWQPSGQDLPRRASALATVEGLLLAGGVPTGSLYSRDSGHTWSTASIDGTTCGITCFAVSPNFANDRVLLAGTDRAGVLRSVDGGRYWHLTNVGLTDFSVLALAVTPSWSPRENVFVATVDGVYWSPNGGRAWKRAGRGLEGVGVQTLAVSTAFATDMTVYAGTEEHGLFRSVDGGGSWQPLEATAAFGAINCLRSIAVGGVPVLIAGTADGTLLRSTDGGESWSIGAEGWPVMVLAGMPTAGVPGRVYAGLDENGLLFSDDAGLTWQPDDKLAARDITRLAAADGGVLLAYGPAGGAWYADDANGWRLFADLAEFGTLSALHYSQAGGWLAATDAGLLHSDDDGASWQLTLQPSNSRIAVIATNSAAISELWAGGTDGSIWHSGDAGRQWQCLATLPSRQPLIALTISRRSGGERRLIAATFDADEQSVTLWRSSNAGARWDRWLSDNTPWPRVIVCPADDGDKDTWVAAGTRLWHWGGTDWQPHDLDGKPLIGLLHLPETMTRVAATTKGVYMMSDGQTWEATEGSPAGLIDLAFTIDSVGRRTILGVEPGGLVWQLPLGA